MRRLLSVIAIGAVLLGGTPAPAAARPAEACRPVVLVHGTFGSAATNWLTMQPALQAAGYCVFALDYGDAGLPLIKGLGPIEESAEELRDYVDYVLAVTGADKVALVGHSQGGLMPRHYLRFLGGAEKVSELIGLAPSNHGTLNPLTPAAALLCPACADQQAGSAFLTKLNAGHEVEPGVHYSVLATVIDEVVVPYTSSFLAGPAHQVTNTTIQDLCGPLYAIEHAAIAFHSTAIAWVLHALERKGPADPDFRPRCG